VNYPLPVQLILKTGSSDESPIQNSRFGTTIVKSAEPEDGRQLKSINQSAEKIGFINPYLQCCTALRY